MRLSADSNSPFYVTPKAGAGIRVFLNGQEETQVYEVDDVEGWVLVYDAKAFKKGLSPFKQVFGHVEILWDRTSEGFYRTTEPTPDDNVCIEAP